MKILLINKYLYPKGGDAISTFATGKLLSEKGHQVFYWGMEAAENPGLPFKEHFVPYVDYNAKLSGYHKLKVSMNILYSFEARRRLGAFLKIIKPDLVHLNNFAHQLSPSILDAIKEHNIPAVMTMRDYKMVCPSYAMFADSQPCEKCRGGRYYYCLLRKCNKSSSLKSLLSTVEMHLHHHVLHIYDKIDLYISPSRFLLEKVREMGMKGKVYHLPNFADLSGNLPPHFEWEAEEIVYVGRLSHEKGIYTLLDAVRGIDAGLRIIGDGPLRNALAEKIGKEKIANARLLGYLKGDALQEEIRRSMFLVIPSEWYENNPRTVIEAFSLGKPVLGARIGGIPELVRDGETGFTFEAGNISDLRDKISFMLRGKEKLLHMGKKAREFVVGELNPEIHYNKLMDLYCKAIGINKTRR
jgi:glycosyltransferase involved in cell wall biosynthesis